MAERKQIFAETRYSVHCSSDHFLFRSLTNPWSQAQFGFRTPMIRNTKQSTLTIAKTLYKCILTTIDDDIHLLISSTDSSRKDHFGWNCSENTVVGSFLCLLRVNGEDLKQVQKHRKAEAKVPRFNISRVFWLLSFSYRSLGHHCSVAAAMAAFILATNAWNKQQTQWEQTN